MRDMSVGGVDNSRIGLSSTLPKMSIGNMVSTESMKVGVVGDNSSVAVSNKTGIGLSLSFTLPKMSIGNMVSTESMKVGVVGDNSAVAVSNKTGIGLSIG